MLMASDNTHCNIISLPKLNKQDILINWINTIKQPKCLLLSTIKQLRDGKVFLEILKHYLIKQGMDETELNVDNRLTPFERIKLVLCSLIELIEDEDKEKVIEFDQKCLHSYTDDLFLLHFGLFLRELYEKAYDNESLLYLNTRSEDEKYQSSHNFNGKDSFFDPEKNKHKSNNHNAYPKQVRNNKSAVLNSQIKQHSIINIVTDYIEDTHQQCKTKFDESYQLNKEEEEEGDIVNIDDNDKDNANDNNNNVNNDKDEEDKDNNEEDYYDDEDRHKKEKKLKLNQLFSNIPIRNQSLKTHETDNHNTHIISSGSLLTCNSKAKMKYTRQQKGEIIMYIGLETTSKLLKNNYNSLSQTLFQHKSFLYPTKPILDISLTSLYKYNRLFYSNTNQQELFNDEQFQQPKEEIKLNISSDSLSTSLLNIIGTNNKPKCLPKEKQQNQHQQQHHINAKGNYGIIVKWLISLCLIKDSNTNAIRLKAKSGELFCDIINRCESKNETIKGIIRSPFTPKQEYLNINKALAYLRTINFRSDCLWSVDQIQKGSEGIIFSLLSDLYIHYSKALGKVKSLSILIKPNHMKRKDDETATLELNDSLFWDNQPNYNNNNNQPMTQLSSYSNILKTPKNNDVSHHTSVTTSNNICTIANCLGVNTSSIKPKGKRLIRNKLLTKQNKSRDKNLSYKPEKTITNNNNSVKLPQCFIILKKPNLNQIKNQIDKVSSARPYNEKKYY